MDKLKKLKKKLVGKIFDLKNFNEPLPVLDVKIINKTIYVKFRYSNKYETIVTWYRYSEVLRDHVKNYLKLHRYDLYRGKINSKHKSTAYLMSVWGYMHARCNNPNVYENTSVCKEWLSYSNFLKWVWSKESNYNENEYQQIDKDILQWDSKFKVYSPNTCVFIPTYLNKYLSGFAKKSVKEKSRAIMLRLNANYIHIGKQEIGYKLCLLDYCRYYVFDRLISYYYNNHKITAKIYTLLKYINKDVNNVHYEDKYRRELPIIVKIKMDNFIYTELEKLKIRETKVCSETRVL